MDINPDFSDLLKALNDANARNLLVGAQADRGLTVRRACRNVCRFGGLRERGQAADLPPLAGGRGRPAHPNGGGRYQS
ncbi:MAG TPA: hypothetical protein VGM03_16980 [Phycisphaerae bacterium]|jgi:hypothetical protein